MAVAVGEDEAFVFEPDEAGRVLVKAGEQALIGPCFAVVAGAELAEFLTASRRGLFVVRATQSQPFPSSGSSTPSLILSAMIVLFTTEFGRTPFAQSAADQVGPGRDHNRYGFNCWMAGAGLKPGIAFGSTDEIGWKAVERPIPWHDFHATVLHLFGIDHEQLTYYHNGIQRRLTNVHGEVLHEILA